MEVQVQAVEARIHDQPLFPLVPAGTSTGRPAAEWSCCPVPEPAGRSEPAALAATAMLTQTTTLSLILKKPRTLRTLVKTQLLLLEVLRVCEC